MLVYFQSEEDRNTAWAPKIAVVIGLTLTCLLVLMLPMDVANRSSAGGLPMDVLWQVLYILVAVMCIGVVPFLMFYYEAWDPESQDWQLWTAIKCVLARCVQSQPSPPWQLAPNERIRHLSAFLPPSCSPTFLLLLLLRALYNSQSPNIPGTRRARSSSSASPSHSCGSSSGTPTCL